jgi:hypothetical protein
MFVETRDEYETRVSLEISIENAFETRESRENLELNKIKILKL